MQLLEDDDLDTGEELPINAFLSWQMKPQQQTPRYLIDTSARF